MKQGEKKKLKAVTTKKVTAVQYRSGKKSIVTVSKKGEIHAKKAGTTKSPNPVSTAPLKTKTPTVTEIATIEPTMTSIATEPSTIEPTMTPIITEPPTIEPTMTPIATEPLTIEPTMTPIVTIIPTISPTPTPSGEEKI